MTQIRSMTGFGSAEAENDSLSVKAEIKSVNNKFLEMFIRLPRSFKDKETELRQELMMKLSRGTVQVNVSVEKKGRNADTDSLQINEPLARAYRQKLEDLSGVLQLDAGNLFSQIISMPDVLRYEEEAGNETDWRYIRQIIEKAYENYDQFRLHEGEKMNDYLLECIAEIDSYLQTVEQEEPKRKEMLRGRVFAALKENIEEGKIDMNRFEQEMIYYLEKFDIGEEKNRLKNHLDFFRKSLDTDPNGKKLHFIAQEMGREINTMGSKANHFIIQQAVVCMKESLEKIKEQLLNII